MHEVNEARLAHARTAALGRSVRRYRGDITQSELASKLGLSQVSISSWVLVGYRHNSVALVGLSPARAILAADAALEKVPDQRAG